MKILLICQYFFPEQFKVNDICFELVKQGHKVTVLTGLPNYPTGIIHHEYKNFKRRFEEINGVKIIRTWILGRGKGKIRLAINYISFALMSTLKTFFMNNDFDVILVYQLSPVTMALPGIALKKRINKPLVLYCHDLWPESVISGGISPNGKLYNLLKKVSKWIYTKGNVIITSSRLFGEYFNEVLNINKEVEYLPVYAEDYFECINMTKENVENINLVFAGNIGEIQSVETIILAANELRHCNNIKIHIVGDGSSRQRCEMLKKELNLDNVIFHGHHPITEMPKYYEMADAFLITLKDNKAISYTIPNKVQSYLAAGKPIIGSINGETRKIINDAKCGLCGDAEDYKELSLNIKRFVQEKEKISFYAQNSKKYYESNFSKNAFFKKLNLLLEKVISDGVV